MSAHIAADGSVRTKSYSRFACAQCWSLLRPQREWHRVKCRVNFSLRQFCCLEAGERRTRAPTPDDGRAIAAAVVR